MPRYSYVCSECDSHFDVFHSLHETYTICKNCGEDGCVERMPSQIFISKIAANSNAGGIVEGAIAEAKDELKIDQSSLKNRIYKK